MIICEKPNYIYWNKEENKWEFLTRKAEKKDTFKKLQIPCGHCKSCLKNKSLEYYQRNLLELAESKTSYFITLTYDQNHYTNKSVDINELIEFTRKLKKEYHNNFGLTNCKYFGVSEYGDKSLRKHFHILVYNIPLTKNDFTKLELKKLPKKFNSIEWTNNRYLNDNNFTNKKIKEIWGKGNITIAPINTNRIKYVVNYLFKSLNNTTKATKKELKDKGLEMPSKIQSTNLGMETIQKNKDKFLFNNMIFLYGQRIYANKYIDTKAGILNQERTERRLIQRIEKIRPELKKQVEINNRKGKI